MKVAVATIPPRTAVQKKPLLDAPPAISTSGWVHSATTGPAAEANSTFKAVREDLKSLIASGLDEMKGVSVDKISETIPTICTSDVIFSVSDKLIKANRDILSCRSPYFCQMFNSGMRESAEPAKVVVLSDLSIECFLKILEFLYTGTLENIDGEIVVELLISAERFMLDDLKSLCEDVIRLGIDTESVSALLITSSRHSARGLKKIAFDYVLDNFEEVKRTEGFKELVKEPELLMELLLATTNASDALPPPPPSRSPSGRKTRSMR